jgi:DnaJ-class molecular chaperone|nr:MAG TPA: hypothetical protein [Caudoviricetes sp.]
MKYINIEGSTPIAVDCSLWFEKKKTKQPYRCPVCLGKGIVPNGFYNCIGNTIISTSTIPEQCKSCNGKGVIWHD